MNDEADNEQNVRLPKWPSIFLAFYLLSIRPFWGLREHGTITRGSTLERGLVTCYLPIETLVRHVPPFKVMMRWYLELFDRP